tara:strand:+ start:2890 stop:4470 length:1581 start_codon:yes stop_codon:yes gene_type:complete
MELSSEQNNALDAFRNGENVFLTGPGGSGKTALIKYMVQNAEEREKEVQVCALTGCAAVLLGCKGAKTLHSWAGIGLANGDVFEVVDRVSRQKHKRKQWEKTDILIIDEVSMMSIKLFEILDRLGRRIRKNPGLPFGGIQVIFSGDFYQLPPVGTNDSPESAAFCFESPYWNTTFHRYVQLTTIFRQTDQVYTKILNQVRTGRISKSSCQHLSNRVAAFQEKCKKKEDSSKDEKICKPTILLPTRRQVDMINNKELEKLSSEYVEFSHTFHDDLNGETAKQRFGDTITPEQKQKELDNLSNSIMADKKLVLKIGAQVMCVANIDMEGDYPIVNGSLGVVEKFVGDAPVVKFYDGQIRIMTRHTWESDNFPGIGVKQIPLILAWAITIHKAQGVTLDLAQIDAGRSIFECGQTYVALSRVKCLEGLYLTSFQPEQIKINRKVRDFYRKLDKYTKTMGNSSIELEEKKYLSAAALRKIVENDTNNDFSLKTTKKTTEKTSLKTTENNTPQMKNIQNNSIQCYFKSKAT